MIVGPLLLIFTFFAKNLLANFIFFFIFGFYFIFLLIFIFFEKALSFLFLIQIRSPVFYFLKKVDKDPKSKRKFSTFLTTSFLKKAYQNPVIKKKWTKDQEVERSMNQAVNILSNMGRPLATLIGKTLLGGGFFLEHHTKQAARQIHQNSCLEVDEKIEDLIQQKRYHRAELFNSRKEWDDLCFNRMRNQGTVSQIARDLFNIPLTEENSFTVDERRRWENHIDNLAKKEVIETREFDKAREIEQKKIIEDEERAARWANLKSIPKSQLHRIAWKGIKMGCNEPLVKEGLQTFFQQLTSILIAKSGEAALKKFEEVLSRGVDGEGTGRIGSLLEERAGYVNQFYTNFLTTFTSFHYYSEKELEALRAEYGDHLTLEIVSHHFILNPLLEREEYE